jgi:hypothetical protein
MPSTFSSPSSATVSAWRWASEGKRWSSMLQPELKKVGGLTHHARPHDWHFEIIAHAVRWQINWRK